MDAAELKQFLIDHNDDIQTKVKDQLIEHLLAQHRWDFHNTVAQVVNDFIATEIAPAIKAELEANRGAILEACRNGVSQIGTHLAQQMVTVASKNLDGGYKAQQIMKALFNS